MAAQLEEIIVDPHTVGVQHLGDDADTTGAVYGQLAGAFHGESGIPPEWRDRLAMGDVIASMAEQLFRFRTPVTSESAVDDPEISEPPS